MSSYRKSASTSAPQDGQLTTFLLLKKLFLFLLFRFRASLGPAHLGIIRCLCPADKVILRGALGAKTPDILFITCGFAFFAIRRMACSITILSFMNFSTTSVAAGSSLQTHGMFPCGIPRADLSVHDLEVDRFTNTIDAIECSFQ